MSERREKQPVDLERPPSAEDEARLAASPTARVLDALIIEARQELDVRDAGSPAQAAGKDVLADVDWGRLESRLMSALEEERPAVVSERNASHRARFLRAGALTLAAAAAVAVFVRRDPSSVRTETAEHAPTVAPAERAPASALRSTEGAGVARVAGVVATPGYVVRASDTIDVDGARAVLERPHKVSWLIEQDGPVAANARHATAHVKSAGETLILGLDHGVIEAQVVPVPSGEAFAVDIATDQNLVRIAVHGTHLRVARSGTRVVVDLTEGVVAIGVPPRTGITVGTTVVAPAHVELDATDLATLRIDHSPASIRPAIPLGDKEARVDTATPPPQAPAQAPASPAAVAKAPAAHEGTTSPTKVDPPKAALPAREAIAAGVRECAAARSRPGDVHVTISSSLRLDVSKAGVVESAQFSPPLSPDVQGCAAQVIYKVKLEETGIVTIPIEFSY